MKKQRCVLRWAPVEPQFYMRAIDYLETLDIEPERGDKTKKVWKQIKMVFTEEDRQALQTLIDNNTLTPEDQLTPSHALKAIQTTIRGRTPPALQ